MLAAAEANLQNQRRWRLPASLWGGVGGGGSGGVLSGEAAARTPLPTLPHKGGGLEERINIKRAFFRNRQIWQQRLHQPGLPGLQGPGLDPAIGAQGAVFFHAR